MSAVLETTLDSAPSVVINSLTEEIQIIADGMSDEILSKDVKMHLKSLMKYIKMPTQEEQFEMAAYYHANKDIFEAMLNPDTSNIYGE